MTLEVRLSPDQLADLADLIVARLPRADAAAPLKLAYTIPEAAQISGCSEHDVRKAIRSGHLPAKQAGERGKYTVHHEALNAWLRGIPAISLSGKSAVRQRKAR